MAASWPVRYQAAPGYVSFTSRDMLWVVFRGRDLSWLGSYLLHFSVSQHAGRLGVDLVAKLLHVPLRRKTMEDRQALQTQPKVPLEIKAMHTSSIRGLDDDDGWRGLLNSLTFSNSLGRTSNGLP
eukprot:9142463-Pyramimonas_sp.AAC.3